MEFLTKNKTLLGGLVLVLCAALLYYFYFGQNNSPLLTSTEDELSPISQQLLITLGNLNTIKLDQSVFEDPSFVSLADFGVTIPPEAVGRRNPFLPANTSPSTESIPAPL